MIRAGTALGAIAFTLVAMPSVAVAQSEEQLSADVSATAGYSNNPFSVTGNDAGSALLTLDFAPRYQIRTERSTITLSGDANLQQYARRYGRNDSYSGALDYVLRPSERITAHTRLDLSSAVLGSFTSLQPVTTGVTTTTGGGTVPGTTTLVVPIPTTTSFVPITDIGLFGLRNRRKLARLSGDMSWGISLRDSLTISGYAEATRYSSLPQFGNYEAYSASLGYSRRVSDRMTVGLRGSASVFEYRTANSNSRVFPVEATVSGRLSERWNIDGALGVTFVERGAAGSTSQTSLSGSVNLCRQGQLTSTCIQAARQVSPTGLVGTQYVTNAGINWSRRLSERENLSLGGSYSKVGGDTVLLQPGSLPLQNEFVQGTVSYDRRLRERLRLVTSAHYGRLLNGNFGRPDDFGGQVGLSYRLGDPR